MVNNIFLEIEICLRSNRNKQRGLSVKWPEGRNIVKKIMNIVKIS